MDLQGEQASCEVGATVYGSDGEEVGRVTAMDAHFLTVEHGLLQKEELRIPRSVITAGEPGTVALSVDGHAALD